MDDAESDVIRQKRIAERESYVEELGMTLIRKVELGDGTSLHIYDYPEQETWDEDKNREVLWRVWPDESYSPLYNYRETNRMVERGKEAATKQQFYTILTVGVVGVFSSGFLRGRTSRLEKNFGLAEAIKRARNKFGLTGTIRVRLCGKRAAAPP